MYNYNEDLCKRFLKFKNGEEKRMKKILSFLLIFTFALAVFGMSTEVSADAVDVTIYLHVHQFDGDYTNTGTGIWDGVNWNNWADVSTSTDEFGGIIMKNYTAAEIAAVDDSIQFKPSRDATVDDSANYLAPGNGEVYLDVTDLKAGSADGTMSELHVYYVEGATDFYVKEVADNSVVFILYANGAIAANENAYDGWGIHTWNAGTNGTSIPDYFADAKPYDIDVFLDAGIYEGVEMKLGAIEVDADASNEIGFITHFGIDASEEVKSCSADMAIDVSGIKPAGDPEVAKAGLVFYEHGTCEFAADSATFFQNIETAYFNGLKNKFVEGTIIEDPQTIHIEFFSPKQPYQLLPERFMVKDSMGNEVPITDIMIEGTTNVSMVPSTVEVQSETVVVVFVETAETGQLGLAGSHQGWAPENATLTSGTSTDGYQVFEFTSFDAEVQFKVLAENGTDNTETADVDESTVLNWGDTEVSGGDNVVLDLSAGGTVLVHIKDDGDVVTIKEGSGLAVDAANFDYTSGVACTEGANLLTVFLQSDEDHTKMGLVGTPQANDWTPGEAIAPTGETTDGLVVFEVCASDVSGGFKILLDSDDNGFAWGDTEITPSDVSYNMGDAMEYSLLVHSDLQQDMEEFTPTLTPTSIYQLSVIVAGGLNPDLLVYVGQTADGDIWDPANPVLPAGVDAFGNVYFDIAVSQKNPMFKILYDGDESGAFDWPDSIGGNDNYQPEFGADTVKYFWIDATDTAAVTTTDLGATVAIDGNVTQSFKLMFADDALMYGEMYTIEYVEAPAVDDVPAEIIMWDLEFAVDLEFAAANPAEMMGTFAYSPTMVYVEYNQVTALLDGLMLKDSMGNEFHKTFYQVVNNDIGDFAKTVTCAVGESVVFVHLNIGEYEGVTSMDQLGLVGSLQNPNEWNPGEAVTPSGMDSNGNYVFEICNPDTEMNNAFKVLFIGDDNPDTLDVDESMQFAWGDPEVINSDIAVNIADGPHFYIEHGSNVINSSTHTSMYHSFQLALADALDVTKEYRLEYVDENGFVVYIDLDIDNEAPVIDLSEVVDADFTLLDTDTEFDLMDYYTRLQFLDNRDGEIPYEIVTDLELGVVGMQTVVIKAVDMWMNEATFEIDFEIVDTTDPVLTIDDAKEYEAGIAAPDWADFASANEGTITIDESQVDMDTAGSFFVLYTATDEAGNSASGSLEVTITAAPEEPEPEPTDTGCFSSFNIGSAAVISLIALGGAGLFFLRKRG